MTLLLVASINSELHLEAIFQPGRFRDAPNNQRIANAFLDESIHLYVLLLRLCQELLHVLLDVKQIVVESFFDRELDKPMIPCFRIHQQLIDYEDRILQLEELIFFS